MEPGPQLVLECSRPEDGFAEEEAKVDGSRKTQCSSKPEQVLLPLVAVPRGAKHGLERQCDDFWGDDSLVKNKLGKVGVVVNLGLDVGLTTVCPAQSLP